MKWVEVVVRTNRDKEDFVSHILYEAGAQGLAIEDPKDVLELAKEPDSWDFFDLNLKELDHDGIAIMAYFSENDDIDTILTYIKENIEVKSPLDNDNWGIVHLSQVDENDWAESWKQFYKPTKVGRSFLIKPNWEDYEAEDDEIIIEMDPGMAFGTGTHETTKLCIEALESFIEEGHKVYDIGCGSGILSIAAAKLGASEVVGVDLDPTAVKVSEENIRINQVEDRVDIRLGNLLEVVEDEADLIVANILAEIVAGMAKDISGYLKKSGIFIASGIILDKVDLVEKSLRENGFEILELKRLNEWASIIARK